MTYIPNIAAEKDVQQVQQSLAKYALASDVTALSQTVAGKADASALAGKADSATVTSALAQKADVTALAGKADAAATNTALAAKADAATVTSALAGKASTTDLAKKADAAAVTALAATVPVPATTAPKAEAVTASAGVSGLAVSGADHQHPRLTSTTYGTIGATGTATINFTRTFVNQPGVVMTEVGGTNAQPAVFKVDSWVQSGGLYTGCIVKAWRAQVMPTLTSVSGILTAVITGVNAIVSALSNFNIFAAPAVGTQFSIVAIQRSDVP